MNTIVLKNTSPDSIATDVMFNIASERACGAEILKLFISAEIDAAKRDKMFSAVQKLLRGMKKQGRIQFFACLDDFTEATTEAQFLKNKYPEQEFFSSEEIHFIIVRI